MARANGKTLEVRLAPASAQEPKPGTLPYLAKLYREDLYEYLRLQGLTLKQGKQQDFMGYTLQWWSEPSSNLSMFKVIAGYPQDRQEQLNQLLMERLWREVGATTSACWRLARGRVHTERQAAVFLLGRAQCQHRYQLHLWRCPSGLWRFPLNIDVNSGRDLSLTDVLWVGKGQPLKQSEHGALYEYNTQQLAPWLVEQFTALHPREMREPASEDEGCNYSDTGVWGDNSWYFTPRGLFISAHFPG